MTDFLKHRFQARASILLEGNEIPNTSYTDCPPHSVNNCRGPRCPVGNKNQPTIYYPPSEVIDVKTIGGATGDGITNDTDAIQQAADTGKILYFPAGNYLVNRSITIINGVYGEGKITTSAAVGFSVTTDHVFVRGITIESTLRTHENAPFSVRVENANHIEISYATLINNRMGFFNCDGQFYTGLKINHNIINGDFSPFPVTTIQNDMITIRGIEGVEIKCNSINFLNPNRIFKIADQLASPFPPIGIGAKVSDLNAKNIVMEDNVITGTTTSGKQVADLFHGTENITFQNNCVEVNGFSSIIENKTGIETHFSQNTVIKNNIFKNNHTILSFQGSYGALTPNHESGFQNITIENNYFKGLDAFLTDRGLISIRFFHLVNCANNELDFEVPIGRLAVTFFSNKNVNFNNNLIKSGGIRFSLAPSNQSGADFNALINSITILSNKFKNGFVSDDFGIIIIDQTGTPAARLIIHSNKLKLQSNIIIPAILLRDTVFNSVDIIDNVGESNSIGVRQSLINDITTYTELTNSWNDA